MRTALPFLFLMTIAQAGQALGNMDAENKTSGKMTNPTILEFPLRGGPWIAPNTPGSRIPSHGTELFGETYAIDFVMVGRTGRKAYRGGVAAYLTKGVPLEDFYCWGRNLYCPIAGEVVEARDGIPERPTVSLLGAYADARKTVRRFLENQGPIEAIAGNYVMIDCGEGRYALLAHLKTGSVAVSVGQRLAAGDLVGQVGHSGNSMMPHLHLQLMDGRDWRKAKGLPIAFRSYEAKSGDGWTAVRDSVPRGGDTIRHREGE